MKDITKDPGRKTNDMVKATKSLVMEIFTLAITNTVKFAERVSIVGQTATNTMGNGKLE